MKLFYAMCGIPGSGKTRCAKWIHHHLGGHPSNIWYICPDEIRLDVNKDESSQANMGLVWDLTYFAIQCAMRNGETIILDATNAKREDRQKLLDFMTDMTEGYELILYYFNVPLDLAKTRNRERERVVPEHVLERMFDFLQASPPVMGEGWSDIRHITD